MLLDRVDTSLAFTNTVHLQRLVEGLFSLDFEVMPRVQVMSPAAKKAGFAELWACTCGES